LTQKKTDIFLPTEKGEFAGLVVLLQRDLFHFHWTKTHSVTTTTTTTTTGTSTASAATTATLGHHVEHRVRKHSDKVT